MVAVVERLNIFDRHGACERALISGGDGDADVALADLGIDGDALCNRDRGLDADLKHTDFAISRAGAGAGEGEADRSAALTALELYVGNAGRRFEVAAATAHQN